jgi:hypothetical protein
MKLNFKNTKTYEIVKTLLGGSDYKFTHYIDELAIRFYTHGSFSAAVSTIAEIGINENADYDVDSYEYHLPALENGWTIG